MESLFIEAYFVLFLFVIQQEVDIFLHNGSTRPNLCLFAVFLSILSVRRI